MAGTWKTVKVFISSTFRDMQAERDHLVRFVFPRLREELLKRRIHLVDVDLRWGVTSEQDALEVCKEIIDECQPRFVCILGGRYGWTPPGKQKSITASEVHYAVFDRLPQQKYRFFYFRDPNVTDSIPEVQAREGGYREFPLPEDIAQLGFDKAEAMARERTAKLESLKQAVCDAGLMPFIYLARWDETEERLADLPVFGEQVYRDLLWSIEDELKTEPPPALDEFASEAAAMETFIEERLAAYVVGSRQQILDELSAFAQGEGEPNILVVTGAAGFGKSALLAKFYRDLIGASPDWLVIPHFVGAGIASTDLRRSLRRLCHELSRAIGINVELPQDIKELLPRLSQLLQQASTSRWVVLVIDALNQMNAADNAYSMHWLPYQLPPTVRIIVSSLEHPALVALKERKERVQEKTLKPLSTDDSMAIVKGFLTQHHKTMTSEQMRALLAKEESGNPLYLQVALEELRTLGTYEEITQHIKHLPSQALELFAWIFYRLEQDPGFHEAGKRIGPALVRDFASLVTVSRYGLSQMELMELLAPGDSKATPPIPPDPYGNVAALLRLLRPYLMHRGELLDFCHGQLREAAKAQYIKGETAHLAAHLHLADYFKSKSDSAGDLMWSGHYVRGLSELPYHQAQAGMWGDFRDTLTSPVFLRAKLTDLGIQSLISDYDLTASQALLPFESEHPQEVKALHLIQGALRLSAHILHSDPAQMASQLTGRLLIFENDAIQSFLQQLYKSQKHPWARPVISSITTPGGPLLYTLTGHSGWIKVLGISSDGRRAVSGDDDGVFKVWDLEYGRELTTLRGNAIWDRDQAEGVVLFQGGKMAATFFLDADTLSQVLSIWEMKTPQVLQTLELEHDVTAIAITPDGHRAVFRLENGLLEVWDLESVQKTHTLTEDSYRGKALAISSDGRRVIFGDDAGDLEIWDLDFDHEPHCLEIEGTVTSVAMSPDGHRAVFGSKGGLLEIWDLEINQNLCTVRGPAEEVTAVTMNQEGLLALSGYDDGSLVVWNLKTGERLQSLLGHTGKILAVEFSVEANQVVSATRSSVKVWDLETGQNLHTLVGPNKEIISLVVTHNGRQAVSVSRRNKGRPEPEEDIYVKVWDLETGLELRAMNMVGNVSVSLDGRRAVSHSSSGYWTLWDIENSKEIGILEVDAGLTPVALSPDGRLFIEAKGKNTLRVWNTISKVLIQTVSKIYHRPIELVKVTPDGKRAVLQSELGQVSVWDLETGKKLMTLPMFCVLTSDGHHALVPSRKTDEIKFWDLEDNREIHALRENNAFIKAMALTPDGRRALLSNSEVIKVYDLETSQQFLPTPPGHTSDINQIAVSLNGQRAVSTDWKTLKVWDLIENKELFTSKDNIGLLALTPEGGQAVSISLTNDRTLKVWGLETRRLQFNLRLDTSSNDWARQFLLDKNWKIREMDQKTGRQRVVWAEQVLSGESGLVTTAALSLDGRRAVVGYGPGTLKVIDLTTGTEVLTLEGHTRWVYKISLSSNGRQAVSLSKDKTLRVWDLETGRPLLVLANPYEEITAHALSPDGRMAAFGYLNGVLHVSDLESGRDLLSLAGFKETITALALSPDGYRAVSGYSDGILKVWDLDKGEEIQTLAGHTELIGLVVISPDGKRVLSFTGSNFKIWDLDEATVLATFTADSKLSACASDLDVINIGVGDFSGQINFITLTGLKPGAALVTPSKKIRPSRWIFWRRPEKVSFMIYCSYCSSSSEIKETALRTEIPCPQCGKSLKINHF